VLRHLAGVLPGSTVLDVACGGGRHLRAALSAGHRVLGVDRDVRGIGDLDGLPGVEIIAADLETGAPVPFAGRRFGGVIVTRYLWRPILPAITAAVAEDGVLIYETFTAGQIHGGKPVRAAFAFNPNELVEAALAAGLIVVRFEMGELPGDPVCGDAGQRVQRLCAVGRAHPWALPESLIALHDG
jgi:SAM-dependent methyltransferase